MSDEQLDYTDVLLERVVAELRKLSDRAASPSSAMTDRECTTVDLIVNSIKEIALSRKAPGEQDDPFTCQQDGAIDTLASLALAVIRHGVPLAGEA